MDNPFRTVVRESHGRAIWQRAEADIMDSLSMGVFCQMDQWLSHCESHIEVKFGIALASVAWFEIAELDGNPDYAASVKPQAPVCDGRYRADFLL